MGRGDEAFYESEVKCIVGGAGHAVASTALGHAVGTIPSTGALDEPNF
jgi:hypothetical protein